MVYKPLDLSFLAARVSPERESIRNTAAMIMANAGWSKPSQVTMREIAAYNKKIKQQQDSMHKQTALSSLFDLLSTPLYGVANAMD
jgi:dihydroorotase